MSGKHRLQWSCLAKLTWVTSDSDLFAGKGDWKGCLLFSYRVAFPLTFSTPSPAQWRKDLLFRDRSLHFHLLPVFVLTPGPAPLRPALSEGLLSLKVRIQAVWCQEW